MSLVLIYVRHFHAKQITNDSKTVYIKRNQSGFELIRNGKPFYIKGAAGNSNLKELADIGGNTIRLYDTINIQYYLDEALRHGLAVIIDVPIPPFGFHNYLDENENKIIKQKVKDLIVKYKNHPALLIWNLGNEVSYPKIHWKDLIRVNHSKKRFVKNFNEIIEIIKSEDTNHPVSTSKWNIGIEHYTSFKIFSPDIDLISFNVFGDTKNINNNMKQYYFLFGEFPFYVSEFGPDGWWMQEPQFTSWWSPIEPSSEKKAEQINSRYNLIVDSKNCFGSLLFYWGNKYECTHTWFSLFKEGHKSEIVMEMEYLWGQSNSQPEFIGLEYMLVEGKGAADNLIFNSGEVKNAELKMDVNENDSLTIKWEIYPDVWYQGWNEEKYNRKLLNPPGPIDCFIKTENKKATFVVPDKEGPYRIFAYVYDHLGYFATTNTPFYVLIPK
ncbi:MAG: hypothetical protein FD181_841 [Prolixibacteraceae bacterium]|nr:MAG: hypothetical protein FD181_841 [Prolixibacteraceae bacterium]